MGNPAFNLSQMAEFAMQNIWDKFVNAQSFRTAVSDWLPAFAELDLNVAEQANAYRWNVPFILAHQELPTVVASQNVTDIEELIEILSRSCDKIRNLSSLDATQTANIIAIYNAAWA